MRLLEWCEYVVSLPEYADRRPTVSGLGVRWMKQCPRVNIRLSPLAHVTISVSLTCFSWGRAQLLVVVWRDATVSRP